MDCYKHFFTIFWKFKWRIRYRKYSSLSKINRQWQKWRALANTLKQFHLQLKSEQKEIMQNVLERKDSMAVLPTRACVTFPPFILDKVRLSYANHLPWYIVVIIVFSKSRDKWLKNKLTWRNDRVVFPAEGFGWAPAPCLYFLTPGPFWWVSSAPCPYWWIS